MTGPWREPREESANLYPGLVVHDGRVSGSITVGPTRLPLWAFIGWAVEQGFDAAAEDYYSEHYHEWFGKHDLAIFLSNLMELRGEFGRLLLVLADAERRDRGRTPWWETKRHRKRVGDQLRRCLEILDQNDVDPASTGPTHSRSMGKPIG